MEEHYPEHALLGEEDVEFGKDLKVGLDPVVSVGGRCAFQQGMGVDRGSSRWNDELCVQSPAERRLDLRDTQ